MEGCTCMNYFSTISKWCYCFPFSVIITPVCLSPCCERCWRRVSRVLGGAGVDRRQRGGVEGSRARWRLHRSARPRRAARQRQGESGASTSSRTTTHHHRTNNQDQCSSVGKRAECKTNWAQSSVRTKKIWAQFKVQQKIGHGLERERPSRAQFYTRTTKIRARERNEAIDENTATNLQAFYSSSENTFWFFFKQI